MDVDVKQINGCHDIHVNTLAMLATSEWLEGVESILLKIIKQHVILQCEKNEWLKN